MAITKGGRKAMTSDANKAVARRFFEEMSNGRRLELADELLAPDHVYHDPQLPKVVGPQALAETLRMLHTNVDATWRVEEIDAAENERVVVRWTGGGRHVGELNGIPPTDRTFEVRAISLLRMDGGKIAEQWCIWDTLGMLQQIGVAPAAPGSA
jgi:steroid delta-isomerase-like uncharacterized protein